MLKEMPGFEPTNYSATQGGPCLCTTNKLFEISYTISTTQYGDY